MPACEHIACEHEVRHAACKGCVRVGFGVGGDEVDHLDQGQACGGQALQNCASGYAAALGQLSFSLFNLRHDGFGGLAAIARCLAADQIVGLNRGGAFVDREDLGIAVILRSASLFNEAHAAMHLHAQAGDFEAHLGGIAFDQGHHEFVEGGILFAHLGIGVMMRCVIRAGCACGKRAAAFGVGAHGHEHALDIGVMNNRRATCHAAIDRAALHAVFRVLNGFLISALCHCNALHAHSITSGIHHDEHVFEATVFLAYQVANRTTVIAILKYRSWRCLDTHLVLNTHAMYIVTSTE